MSNPFSLGYSIYSTYIFHIYPSYIWLYICVYIYIYPCSSFISEWSDFHRISPSCCAQEPRSPCSRPPLHHCWATDIGLADPALTFSHIYIIIYIYTSVIYHYVCNCMYMYIQHKVILWHQNILDNICKNNKRHLNVCICIYAYIHHILIILSSYFHHIINYRYAYYELVGLYTPSSYLYHYMSYMEVSLIGW